jgi:ribosomal protein L40E
MLKKVSRSLLIILIISMAYLSCVSCATAANVTLINPVISYNPVLKSSLGMALTLNTSSAYAGSPVYVVAAAKYPNGTSIGPGYTITLTCTPAGGSFGVSTGTTGYTKTMILISSINTNFIAPAPGTYKITATVHDPNGVYWDGVANQTVTILASPTVAPVTPTAVVQTPTPVVQANTPTAQAATPTAVIQGTPTATAPANVTTAGTNDLGPLLPYIAIAVVILLLIILVVAFFWFKRTLRLELKKSSAPADGKSTVPVRVSFVNGLGMASRPRSDTDITLESSAGTIQSVVLQSGRDFVDATLTTSREFGPVTVRARAAGKEAKSTVNFVYDKASIDLAVAPDTIPADGKSSANVTLRIRDGSGNFIAPLQEMSIDLKSTLGNIASPVKMPPKVQSVNSSITSGDVSGTAAITAVGGGLRGEAVLTFEGTAKRFCMHCGYTMTMEASQCPKCGLIPPSGVDVKQCPTCSTVIPESAAFCYHCGARQPEMAKTIPPQDPGANKN